MNRRLLLNSIGNARAVPRILFIIVYSLSVILIAASPPRQRVEVLRLTASKPGRLPMRSAAQIFDLTSTAVVPYESPSRPIRHAIQTAWQQTIEFLYAERDYD